MKQPNILLILADELRADALGCYGNAICRTPNLDRLTEQGTCFEQCMITQPTCTPSRASILTGCFPSALRSRMVGCETLDDSRFLPRVLSAAGYRTASIGKIHLVPQGAEPETVTNTRKADETFDYYGFQHVDLVNGHGMHCFGPSYSAWQAERVPDAISRIGTAAQRSPGVNSGPILTQNWNLTPEAHAGEYITERTNDYLRDATAHNEPVISRAQMRRRRHEDRRVSQTAFL